MIYSNFVRNIFCTKNFYWRMKAKKINQDNHWWYSLNLSFSSSNALIRGIINYWFIFRMFCRKVSNLVGISVKKLFPNIFKLKNLHIFDKNIRQFPHFFKEFKILPKWKFGKLTCTSTGTMNQRWTALSYKNYKFISLWRELYKCLRGVGW